ncbi:N-acetyltransferase [Myxococcota bacterium]|nr:N-acetyltransferase [Myxococcota bacterium]
MAPAETAAETRVIQHEEDDAQGAFFVEDDDGNRIAEMTYAREGQIWVIDHTEVDASLKGKGIGRALVDEAVRFARQRGTKIRPVCSFARGVFAKAPELADVLVAPVTH